MSFEKPSSLELFEDRWLTGGLFSGWYRHHVEQLGLKGTEKILDFGCGSGNFARFAVKKLKKGGQITCLDTSKAWLEIAKKRLNKQAGISFSHKTIQEMMKDQTRFDLINVHWVLHNIPVDQRRETVQTLVGSLNTGGRLIIKEPTRETHGMPSWQIRDLMREAGLVEVKCQETKSMKGPAFLGFFRKDRPSGA